MPKITSEYISFFNEIKKKYDTLTSVPFLRVLLDRIEFPSKIANSMTFFTRDFQAMQIDSFIPFPDLYRHFIGMGAYLYKIRVDLLPEVGKEMVSENRHVNDDHIKLVNRLAATNFPSNLDALAQILKRCYEYTLALDEEKAEQTGKEPFYLKEKKLEKFAHYLAVEKKVSELYDL